MAEPLIFARHAFLPEIGDEVGCVVAFVGGERETTPGARVLPVDHRQRCLSFGLAGRLRRIRLHHETVPVLDQRVAHEVELCRLAVALAEQLCFRVCLAFVRVILALFAMKIAFAVAAGPMTRLATRARAPVTSRIERLRMYSLHPSGPC